MAFKLIQRNLNREHLPSCAHVLQKTSTDLVISRCRLAEYGEEMYQNLKRTCRAFVYLIKSDCFVLFCDVLVAIVVVAS